MGTGKETETMPANLFVPCGQSCKDLGAALEDMQNFALAEIDWAKCGGVVTGVEPGWDQAMAFAAMGLKIPVHVVLPCASWIEQWGKQAQKRCDQIIAYCNTLTWMGLEGKQGAALDTDKYLVSLGDQVMVLGRPGWVGARESIGTLRKLKVNKLWESWVESGMDE